MTPEEKTILQKLKSDFIHYASKCLKIRTKSGSVEPFTLNKAQLHIHAEIERQKGETGKVRVLILKGRQQGCCFEQNMKVLTGDYRWIPIKDVKVGDQLVACDEDTYGITKSGRKHSRKFRTAIVEYTQEYYKDVIEVLFDNGARLEVTGDHRMLCKKRGGADAQWRHVQDFIVGDEVRIAVRPPDYKTLTHEDGWFSGVIDGEGYEGHELPGKAAQGGIRPWAKVISIKPLERKRVIDLQTSTKTFICEGLVSHNSTYVGGRFYHIVSWTKGTQAFILTHALDATQNLYKMAKRYYENTPACVKPQVSTSNSKELIFGLLDSGYKLGTAENKAVGRSATIQLLHGSEVAFWANASEHAKGIMQAVPSEPKTEIILESTANGIGNFFHQQWQQAESGLSDFRAIFVPWFWQDEYAREPAADYKSTSSEDEMKRVYGLNDAQMNWRRYKIAELSVSGQDGEKAFKQEYPCSSQEAFQTTGEDTYIEPDLVMRARKCKAERYGNLVIGVDPARFGDDRTCIIRRQGRVAFELESYNKKDTMEVAGIVHGIIEYEKPFKVFVDVGGLGAGVVDRLYELGHRDIVIAVNAGSTPLDSRRYLNKRAEMWGKLKEWLNDEPVQIPDNDSLHADLCGIRYKVDSNSRLVMERKEDMKKRGIRSPDSADAICLTFALPESALDSSRKQNQLAAKLMFKQNAINATRDRVYGRF